jgi:hypothetical protein
MQTAVVAATTTTTTTIICNFRYYGREDTFRGWNLQEQKKIQTTTTQARKRAGLDSVYIFAHPRVSVGLLGVGSSAAFLPCLSLCATV